MQPSLKNTTKNKSSGLVPDYFVNTIFDIDFIKLKNQGVKYLVFDVDHTLSSYHAVGLDEPTNSLLQKQIRDGTVQSIFIASNSLRDLSVIATGIDAQIVHATLSLRKPMKKYYYHLLDTIGCKPHDVVMIGDRLINDVWGANRVGMMTILVTPIGKDLLIDRLLHRRFWGKQYLRKQRTND